MVTIVIASEAKQSSDLTPGSEPLASRRLDCFVASLLAMTGCNIS
ncbi:MAG: hypothetical protein OJF48_002244 [Afipia sp.]|nr:MAG: hypothetical protein OJF48_002244 [Afipia sp.]